MSASTLLLPLCLLLAACCAAPPPRAQSLAEVEDHAPPDPPPAVVVASAVASADPGDFEHVRQLYCNGSCSWAGAQGCDRADADVLCKLKTRDPGARALRYRTAIALDEGGFSCPNGSYGRSLGPWTAAGIRDVRFQDTSVRANHGPGEVVYDVECTSEVVLAQ